MKLLEVSKNSNPQALLSQSLPLAQTSPAADNGNVDNGDGGRVGMALGMFVGSPVLETVGDLLGDSLVESIVGVVGARVGAVVGNLDGAAANGTKLGGLLMIIAAGGDGPLRNTHLPITTPFEQA
jgi:hypothetical protein